MASREIPDGPRHSPPPGLQHLLRLPALPRTLFAPNGGHNITIRLRIIIVPQLRAVARGCVRGLLPGRSITIIIIIISISVISLLLRQLRPGGTAEWGAEAAAGEAAGGAHQVTPPRPRKDGCAL